MPRSSRRPSQTAKATKWKDPYGSYLTRQWFLFESTFALTMLEPWEKLLVISLFALLFLLILTGMYRYLPYHLEFVSRRARFYILGDEDAAVGMIPEKMYEL